MDPIKVLESYGLLVCTKCHHAVFLNELATHLRSKHKQTINPKRRQAIIQQASNIPGLFNTLKQLQAEFPWPTNPIPAIPDLLGPYNDGFKCRQCPCIHRTPKGIKDHCRDKHGWINPRTRGGNATAKKIPDDAQPFIQNVWCQQFFHSRSGARYFEVIPTNDHIVRQAPDIETADTHTTADTIIQHYHEAQHRTPVIRDLEGKAEQNPWVRRVGWAAHLQNFEPAFIRRTVLLDVNEGWGSEDTDSRSLLTLGWQAIDDVVLVAQKNCSPEDIGIPILFILNQKDPTKKPTRPFSAQLERGTVRRYTNTWKQIFGYIVRTRSFPQEERPPYIMLRTQLAALSIFEGLLYEQMRGEVNILELHRACIDFLVSLLDQELPGSSYDSVLLSALAAIGVRQDGGWVQPQDYTGVYAAVIKIARILVLYQSRLEVESYEDLDLFPHVQEKVLRFMTSRPYDGQPTPMDWIFESMTYGFKIQTTTMAQGHAFWDGDTISYETITFSLPQMTEMIHNLAARLDDIIQQLLFQSYGIPIPDIYCADLYDDIGNNTVGFSFLKDNRNTVLLGLDTLLLRQLFKNLYLRDRWTFPLAEDRTTINQLPQTAPVVFRTQTIEDYLALIDRFRETLLVLSYLIAGLPPRSTELISIRHFNTPYGNTRNIFIDNKMLCILTTYHKGYALSGQLKVIYRYLPPKVGDIVVRYLVFVLPFCHQIFVHQYGQTAELSPHVWEQDIVRRVSDQSDDAGVARLWSSDKFRRKLDAFSKEFIGVSLNIRRWRHIAVSIGRRYLKKEFDNTVSIEPSYGAYTDYHSDDEDVLPDHAIDLQAAHSTFTADVIYGREVYQGRVGFAARQEQFRKVSLLWHKLFQFTSYDKLLGITDEPDDIDDTRRDVRRRRLDKMRRVDTEGVLRQLLRDEHATFKGNQRAAVDIILAGKTPVLHITGTGGGKSMSFMLPSYAVSDGVSIVIVPFIALQEDLQARCEEMGLSCSIWRHDLVTTDPIILVTPETFATQSFTQFLVRLNARYELDRIVLDECHTILDASYDFRPQLLRVGQSMIKAGVQLVFLTATMPPRDESRFWTTVGLSQTRATVVRGTTIRPNIEYCVVAVQRVADEIEQAATLARETISLTDPVTQKPTRVIIYCQRVAKVEEMAERIRCFRYYAAVGEPEEKRGIVRQWREDGGAIVATSALGAGIDIPDIRLIIHVGLPKHLRDFVQESGRAGRDGQPCKSVVFTTRARTTTTRDGRAIEPHEEEDVKEYVNPGIGCRRDILARVFDGTWSRTRCEGEVLLCDLCQARVQRANTAASQAPRDIILPRLYRRPTSVDSGSSDSDNRSYDHHIPDEMVVDDTTQGNDSSVGRRPTSTLHTMEEDGADDCSTQEDTLTNAPDFSRTTSEQARIDNPVLPLLLDAATEARIEDSRYAIRTINKQVQTEARQVRELRACLDFLREHCMVCLTETKDWSSYEPHQFLTGPCQQQQLAASLTQRIREVKRIMAHRVQQTDCYGCWFCYVPQAFCNAWEPKEDDEGSFRLDVSTKCSYDKRILEAAALMIAQGKAKQVVSSLIPVVQKLGVNATPVTSPAGFFTFRLRWGGLQSYGICMAVWLYVYKFVLLARERLGYKGI